MTSAQRQFNRVSDTKIAASLVYEARLKEYEAACWLELGSKVTEAAANVHSALDAMLDATNTQIVAVKAQYRGGA